MMVCLVVTGLPPAAPETASAAVTGCDDIPNPIEALDLLALELPPDCYLIGHKITDQGVGALVPPPGHGVYTQAHSAKKRAKELLIETAADGSVQLRYPGDVVGKEFLSLPPIPPIPSLPLDPDLLELEDPDLEVPELPLLRITMRDPCSSCLPACKDDARHIVGFKEYSSHGWKIHRPSTPKKLDRKRVTRLIKKSFQAVTDVFNDCNMSPGAKLSQTFEGRTKRRGNYDSAGNCLNPDGRSVVDFGPVESSGVTCSWFKTRSGYNRHLESDVRLSKKQRWTLKPGSGCSNRLDLRSLVTHEVGHVFGLGHVGSANKNLTMTERIPVCTTAHRTLGLGDIRGLRALYK